MTIPIANPEISEAARNAVDDVLQSGMIADGEVVRAFEKEFAEYVGTDHAVATANGTAALHVMLEAAGIGEGDAVITTPFSFIASANAIVHAGAEPVFGDIDSETYNLDPATVRPILEARDDVAGILPVHLYGLPADMGALRELASAFDVWLFEDAAQAHGATYDGEMAGSIGDAGAFSFYPTKNMTTGEGGMVVTDDDDVADRVRKLIDHGRIDRYHHDIVGYNYRMTNLQAAIGREQLTRLPAWLETRRANAAGLSDHLQENYSVTPQSVPDGRRHAFHQYTIRTNVRGRVIDELDNAEIGYGIYYPETIPGQRAYGHHQESPAAERLTEEVISIPIHPRLSDADIERIAGAIASVNG